MTRSASVRFALIGAVSGALAAGAVTFYRLGDVGAPRVFDICFGIRTTGDRCGGVDGALYLFPGIIFGVLFAAALVRLGRLDAVRAAGFAIASGVANAIAVFLCVWLFDRFGELIATDIADLPLGLAGAVAGLAGGTLLSGATRLLVPGTRIGWPVIAAAALGLLTPLVVEWEIAGTFAFYILWQGGYAAALGTALSRPG